MNIKDLQIMLSVCDTLEKYKLYSINDNDNDNEKERANKGYIKYAKLILNIIQGCLGKLDGELSTIDNINRISFRYNEFEISFILVGNNLKIFLTINENNTKNKNDNNNNKDNKDNKKINDQEDFNFEFVLNENEINIYIEFEMKEYLAVQFKKDKKTNLIEYMSNNSTTNNTNTKKIKKYSKRYDLEDIINNISLSTKTKAKANTTTNASQKELLVWEKLKDFYTKIERLFCDK